MIFSFQSFSITHHNFEINIRSMTVLQKLKEFCVFTTKPKLDDLVCDSKRWMNPRGDVL